MSERKETKAQSIGKTIIKLLVISFFVGWAMSWFDLTPQAIIENFGATVARAYSLMIGWMRDIVPYVLLGATIVVPIWAVLALLKLGGRRSRKDGA